MNVEAIFHQLTNGARSGAVRAGWVESYLESPITFWCDRHAPANAKDPMNDYQQHLFDAGNAHQDRVNEQFYPGGVQEIFTDEEQGFRRSLEVMSEGWEFLKNMPWSAGRAA